MDKFRFEQKFIGFEEALSLALDSVLPLPEEWCSTADSLGRIAFRDITAIVDSPSVDSSMKDGYAVVSGDISAATFARPVELKLIGIMGAGADPEMSIGVAQGTAVRILSGSVIPEGADAVLAEEFTEQRPGAVLAFADAYPGRNILGRGTDVSAGEVLVRSGTEITPPRIGLLAAGGVSQAPVVRRPRVGLLATGDEVLLPGKPMKEGKLYASNVALQEAWLRSKGIPCSIEVCGDSFDKLAAKIESMIGGLDVLITSGGAWTGDRDLVVKVLDSLGWKPIFHRVRMGPGKAVGMGLIDRKTIFCLPGGPPSNEMAFFMIVLPSLLRMAGCKAHPFPQLYGRLVQEVVGQSDWTQFIHCNLSRRNHEFRLAPLDMTRRLSGMNRTRAIVKIPEGVERLESQTIVPFAALDLDGIEADGCPAPRPGTPDPFILAAHGFQKKKRST
jgi:molybdopterin molybdotransferase